MLQNFSICLFFTSEKKSPIYSPFIKVKVFYRIMIKIKNPLSTLKSKGGFSLLYEYLLRLLFLIFLFNIKFNIKFEFFALLSFFILKKDSSKTRILEFSGAPGVIRTRDPRLRRPLLYPAELRVLKNKIMVGTTGFEPATPSSQAKCATKLRYVPFMTIKRKHLNYIKNLI